MEYAILLATVAVVIIVSVAFLGGRSRQGYECVAGAYAGTTSCEPVASKDCKSQNQKGNGCFGK